MSGYSVIAILTALSGPAIGMGLVLVILRRRQHRQFRMTPPAISPARPIPPSSRAFDRFIARLEHTNNQQAVSQDPE